VQSLPLLHSLRIRPIHILQHAVSTDYTRTANDHLRRRQLRICPRLSMLPNGLPEEGLDEEPSHERSSKCFGARSDRGLLSLLQPMDSPRGASYRPLHDYPRARTRTLPDVTCYQFAASVSNSESFDARSNQTQSVIPRTDCRQSGYRPTGLDDGHAAKACRYRQPRSNRERWCI